MVFNIRRVCATLAATAVVAAGFAASARAEHALFDQASLGPTGGNGAFDAIIPAVLSADGSHAFFRTYESLVPADTDAQPDVYERAGGSTTLVSTGPNGG